MGSLYYTVMAKQGDATGKVPQTAPGERTAQSTSKSSTDQLLADQTVFITMALAMGWQLALVVLVPIIGGSLLDGHFGTTPVLTLIGLAVAAAGVFVVLAYTVRTAKGRGGFDGRGTRR